MKTTEVISGFKPGVLNGEEVQSLLNYAKENKFALPAINAIDTNFINAILETANSVNSPIILQFSNCGASFLAGKSLDNTHQKAAIVGAILGANHVHAMAEFYELPVILHTDHADRRLLPWVDGLLDAGEKYYEKNGKPLFSSHMIDLSDEPLEENIAICKKYLARMSELGMTLEIVLGTTEYPEDDMADIEHNSSGSYTQPEEIAYAYNELTQISDRFIIAASFGNVHGVYKPGNIDLKPIILKKLQTYIEEKFSTGKNPVNFVFQGGSGSPKHQIKEAIEHGVVKMNIDADIQWAYWNGIMQYYHSKKDFLQSQIGSPLGGYSPNKKYYDPLTWLREGEKSLAERLKQAFYDLNAINVNPG